MGTSKIYWQIVGKTDESDLWNLQTRTRQGVPLGLRKMIVPALDLD